MPEDFWWGRGRLLIAAAFVLAAALCATSAVAYVVASRDNNERTAGPRVRPTLVFLPPVSASPTPAEASPSPSTAPAPRVTASPTPAATVAATASPSASPAAHVPAPAPKPSPTRTLARDGLFVEAGLDRAQGGTTGEQYDVTAHATDGDGTIYLQSVDWGDGAVSTAKQRGTACSPAPKAPADCRNYTVTHTYTKPGSHVITLTFVSGIEKQVLRLTAKVSAAPSPTPSPTA